MNCPHCGMTTSFAHIVRGQWRESWHSNPGALVLAPLLVAVAVWCFVVSGSGHWWLTTEPTWWLIFGGSGYLLTAMLLWLVRLL